jgi:hypothetical protein
MIKSDLEVVLGAANSEKLLLGVVAELSSTSWRSSELLGFLRRARPPVPGRL